MLEKSIMNFLTSLESSFSVRQCLIIRADISLNLQTWA